MKKSILKTLIAIMLFAITLSAVLYSCKKNVGDVPDPEPSVLNPDFEITTIDYAFDNEALNSASGLSFKVVYTNNENTETTYYSVLNFYVDGVIQESIELENISANIKYETVFDWPTIVGEHDFKFEINLSSNKSKIIKEANTTNNSQSTSLDIKVKKLVALSTADVATSVVNQIIAADPEANVADVLASEGNTISTTVQVIETTYTDNTSAIVAAVAKSDGTIDETKVVLSVTSNAGVTTGPNQQATSTLIVETLVEQKEVSFYNANEKLTYNDRVLSFTRLNIPNVDCTEPSNLELLFTSESAKKAFVDEVLAAIDQSGVAVGLASAPDILSSILAAYNFTQGNVDNPPTYTVEITNSLEICSTDCVNGLVVYTLSFPGSTIKISDDRGIIPNYIVSPSCTISDQEEITITDCGNHVVVIPGQNRVQPVITTTNPCEGNVHN